MSTITLILLTLVPVIGGYIRTYTFMIPGIGLVMYYAFPLLITVFWFLLGTRFAHTNWKIVPAILIGNAVGIVSILVYLWQKILESAETRNKLLFDLSQMFSACAPGFLTKLVIMFEKEPNTIGLTSAVAVEVLSFVYMISIFSVALLWERKRIKEK